MIAKLDDGQRMAGIAAGVLLLTLFLPWYRKSVVVSGGLAKDNLSAFGVFSFVEAAIFVVAAGVFVLLYARAKERPFHLPGGDGTVIFAAGLWAAALLLWRVFDRPGAEDPRTDIGITWGFFFAFLAAGALAAAGWRIRSAQRPEPANPMAAEPPAETPARRRRQPVADPPTAVTEYLPSDEAKDLAVTEVPDWDDAPTRIAPDDPPEPPEAPHRPHRHRGQD